QGWQTLLERWEQWDGTILRNPEVYRDALWVEEALTNLVLGRLIQAYGFEHAAPRYTFGLRRAWLLRLMQDEAVWSKLGLKREDAAAHIFRQVTRRPIGTGYALANRSRAQHPFAANVPLVGALFAVAEPPQTGSPYVVRVESPRAIAS